MTADALLFDVPIPPATRPRPRKPREYVKELMEEWKRSGIFEDLGGGKIREGPN